MIYSPSKKCDRFREIIQRLNEGLSDGIPQIVLNSLALHLTECEDCKEMINEKAWYALIGKSSPE